MKNIESILNTKRNKVNYYGLNFCIELCNRYYKPLDDSTKKTLSKFYNRLNNFQILELINLENLYYGIIMRNVYEEFEKRTAKQFKILVLDKVVEFINKNEYINAYNHIIKFYSLFENIKPSENVSKYTYKSYQKRIV